MDLGPNPEVGYAGKTSQPKGADKKAAGEKGLEARSRRGPKSSL